LHDLIILGVGQEDFNPNIHTQMYRLKLLSFHI
jgi:hypothetical protein